VWANQLPRMSSVSQSRSAVKQTGDRVTLPSNECHPTSPFIASANTTFQSITAVSQLQDADNANTNRGNGNEASNETDDEGNGIGNTQNITDVEIKALLLAETPVRQIAARMRGRMQKRLERIEAIKATLGISTT
jgi:hypothetical protein